MVTWLFKSATKPAATTKGWSALKKVIAPAVSNNIKHTSSEPSKANTNVILTEFEQSALDKLRVFDNDWVLLKDCTKADIYSKTIIDKTDEEWKDSRVSFLNFRGRFIWPTTGSKLNVTLIVVDDNRFYMALWNKEIKDSWWQDVFINHLEHMQEIYFATNWYSLTPEQIESEVIAINAL